MLYSEDEESASVKPSEQSSSEESFLKPERGGKELIERIDKRITALSYHILKDYWQNFTPLFSK